MRLVAFAPDLEVGVGHVEILVAPPSEEGDARAGECVRRARVHQPCMPATHTEPPCQSEEARRHAGELRRTRGWCHQRARRTPSRGRRPRPHGSWVYICHDGKVFNRVLNDVGHSTIFSEGPDARTRDPMLFAVPALPEAYTFRIVYVKQ